MTYLSCFIVYDDIDTELTSNTGVVNIAKQALVAEGLSTKGKEDINNTINDVINAWMNSPGHRDNILNPRYKFFSISSYNHNGMIYWDMLFSC